MSAFWSLFWSSTRNNTPPLSRTPTTHPHPHSTTANKTLACYAQRVCFWTVFSCGPLFLLLRLPLLFLLFTSNIKKKHRRDHEYRRRQRRGNERCEPFKSTHRWNFKTTCCVMNFFFHSFGHVAYSRTSREKDRQIKTGQPTNSLTPTHSQPFPNNSRRREHPTPPPPKWLRCLFLFLCVFERVSSPATRSFLRACPSPALFSVRAPFSPCVPLFSVRAPSPALCA